MGALSYRNRPKFHLSLDEAAARFGVSRQLLQNAVRLHQLPSRREGRQTWVTASNVAAFVERERHRSEHTAAWRAADIIAARSHFPAA
jgi:transposase